MAGGYDGDVLVGGDAGGEATVEVGVAFFD